MKNAEIIRQARKLITPREAWNNRGWFAANASGKDCSSTDPDAVCWCIFGALNKVTDCYIPPKLEETLTRLVRASSNAKNAGLFNDTHTHEEVLALLDKAADELEANDMNDETTKRMIAHAELIIEALRSGRQLQMYLDGGWRNWEAGDISLSTKFDLRIKPEPRELWVNEYAPPMAAAGHATKELAVRGAEPYALRIAVRYREVIED